MPVCISGPARCLTLWFYRSKFSATQPIFHLEQALRMSWANLREVTVMARLALVTGASSGIGLELARLCAEAGHDLLLASDTPHTDTDDLGISDSRIECVEADLSTEAGVDALLERLDDRQIDFLFANAGHGLGQAFIDQDWRDIRQVIDTNVTGTLYLAHHIARRMARQRSGKILFTGSIAGYMPGTFQAAYNASKAFLDSFSTALRQELQDTDVSVTVLMPGPTDTEFFERAGMMDTRVGQGPKADPAKVAKAGFEVMMNGDADIVPGLKNKLQVALSEVMPEAALAKRHRQMAEPGGADD